MPRPVGSKNKVYKEHCNRGHLVSLEGRYDGGQCVACVKEKATKWVKDNPERRAENWARWLSENLEKQVAYGREKNLKRSGWSSDRFSKTLVEQSGLCAVCGEPFTLEDMPCADHEHTDPPKPRGLLHRRCNSALGMLKDSPEVCEAAAKYLIKWKNLDSGDSECRK